MTDDPPHVAQDTFSKYCKFFKGGYRAKNINLFTFGARAFTFGAESVYPFGRNERLLGAGLSVPRENCQKVSRRSLTLCWLILGRPWVGGPVGVFEISNILDTHIQLSEVLSSRVVKRGLISARPKNTCDPLILWEGVIATKHFSC